MQGPSTDWFTLALSAYLSRNYIVFFKLLRLSALQDGNDKLLVEVDKFYKRALAAEFSLQNVRPTTRLADGRWGIDLYYALEDEMSEFEPFLAKLLQTKAVNFNVLSSKEFGE